uniref:Uncharacterized protein n=1 Tax=Hyaloperonospora arabidopsidis (strain Emoy2) TaxID=559515 RepID=M4BK63_HYAAE
MGLFGSMSGHLLGRFTAGIIVTVMRVVVEGRQVALNERHLSECRRNHDLGPLNANLLEVELS